MKQFLWMLCLTLVPALHACDDNDGYSVGDFTPPLWATAHVSATSFYLDCDLWGTLLPVNTNLTGVNLTNGQRVITSFNPLYDDYQGYDHAVKLLSIRPVLTKPVLTLTEENKAELGNDPITIYKGDLTISGNHVNLFFLQYLPATKKHYINLVRPEADADFLTDDGYAHLQLLYNTYDDNTPNQAFGAVSFSLAELDLPDTLKGIKIKLHSAVNSEVEVVFEVGKAAKELSSAAMSDRGIAQMLE